jgi:dTMP kinase
LKVVEDIIEVAVGDTRPNLTLFLMVPPEVSRQRRLARQSTMAFMRDRMEEADASFFARVAKGYQAIAAAEPERVRTIDATGTFQETQTAIWRAVEPLLRRGESV